MEAIKEWARQLVFLVLFAAFLELLLPGKSMRRFIRAIIGLFLMLAVLKPAVAALEYGAQINVPAFGSAAFAPETAEAKLSSDGQEDLKYAVYRQELARQLQAAAQTMPGVAAARAEVELGAKVRSEVARVTLWIKPEPLEDKRKIEVCLDKNETRMELKPELRNKILHRIKALYELPAEKIELKLWQ